MSACIHINSVYNYMAIYHTKKKLTCIIRNLRHEKKTTHTFNIILNFIECIKYKLSLKIMVSTDTDFHFFREDTKFMMD